MKAHILTTGRTVAESLGVKPAKGTPEGVVVKACLDLLNRLGIVSWRQNSGAMLGFHKGKRRFVKFNTMAGISDIIGFLGDGHGARAGQFIAVECKAKGGKPTPEQTAFLDMVRRHGGLALCVHSADELIEALKMEGICL